MVNMFHAPWCVRRAQRLQSVKSTSPWRRFIASLNTHSSWFCLETDFVQTTFVFTSGQWILRFLCVCLKAPLWISQIFFFWLCFSFFTSGNRDSKWAGCATTETGTWSASFSAHFLSEISLLGAAICSADKQVTLPCLFCFWWIWSATVYWVISN